MPEQTVNAELGFITEGQQGNDVTFSTNMSKIDGLLQLVIVNQTTTEPTLLVNGTAYAVPLGGTGDFAGHDGELAFYQDQWHFVTPKAGWRLYDQAQSSLYIYSGTAWEAWAAGGGGDFAALTNKNLAASCTGVYSGLEVTVNAVNSDLFDVAAGVGIIASHTDEGNPTWTKVTFAGLSAITVTNLATASFTSLALDTNGSIIQVPNEQAGPELRRLSIPLPRLLHIGHTEITHVSDDSQTAYGEQQNLMDLALKNGPGKLGLYYGANGANLNVDLSGGEFWQLGANYANDVNNPNIKTIAGESLANFVYSQQDGLGDVSYVTDFIDTVDPDSWDDGTGVTATVPTNHWTIQRFWFFGTTGTTALSLGQTVYASYNEAISALQSEEHVLYSQYGQRAVNTTRLIVKQGATDLSDKSQAVFIKFDKGQPATAATATLENQALLSDMGFTGYKKWNADETGDYYEIIGGNTFKLLRGGEGWVLGSSVAWAGGQDAVALTQYYTNYLYVDSDGIIHAKINATAEDELTNVFLFEAYYDGGVFVVRENHTVCMPTCTADYLHDVIGIVLDANGAIIDRVTTGDGTLATDREIKSVGEGAIYDHGIKDIIPDSGGAGVEWNTFYTNAAMQWESYNTQTELNMYWNNAGVPELGSTLPNNGYIIQTLYVSKTDLNSAIPKYVAVMGDAQYSSLATAEAAINAGQAVYASDQLALLELAQLGYVIVKNNGNGGQVEEVQVSKTVLNAQSIAQQGNSAAQISANTTNFDGMLDETDSPVQAALDTIDEFGKTSGFEIKDETDLTKTLALVLSNIATGTQRTITVGDSNVNFNATTEDFVLTYNLATGWTAKAAPGAGGGETNTASNNGTLGVGVFDNKDVYNFQFRNIASANSKLTVALDGNKNIVLSVIESQLIHDSLGGLTNHVPNTPGTPGVTTQYNLNITSGGVKSWVIDEGGASGGFVGLSMEVKTADFTIAPGGRFVVDSATTIKATLPATWEVGDEFEIVSLQGTVEMYSSATGQILTYPPETSDTSTGAAELLCTVYAGSSSHWNATSTLRFVEAEQGERGVVNQTTQTSVKYNAPYSTVNVTAFGGVVLTSSENSTQKALEKLDTYITGLGRFGLNALTDAANISVDLNDGDHCYVTLAGNRTLDNPTNVKAGSTWQCKVTQDATGSRTMVFGTYYKWPDDVPPELTATPGAIDILSFTVFENTTEIHGAILSNSL